MNAMLDPSGDQAGYSLIPGHVGEMSLVAAIRVHDADLEIATAIGQTATSCTGVSNLLAIW